MLTSLLETRIFQTGKSNGIGSKYDRLLEDDELRDEMRDDKDSDATRKQTLPQLPQRSPSYWRLVMLLLIGVSVVLFASTLSMRQFPGISHGINWISCGNSTEEAISRGCHFDPMLISWVPDACYFAQPGDEYEAEEFSWYADEHLKQPLSLEDVHTGNYTQAFTDGTHHDQHCIYTWRKLSIALEMRLPLLDSKTANFHHSTHCAQMVRGVIQDTLAGKRPYEGPYSSVPLLFADCVPLF